MGATCEGAQAEEPSIRFARLIRPRPSHALDEPAPGTVRIEQQPKPANALRRRRVSQLRDGSGHFDQPIPTVAHREVKGPVATPISMSCRHLRPRTSKDLLCG